MEWLRTRVTPVCFHGEHQSNYPLATVKFPCHFFFLKARVERNRQLALARRSSVIPEMALEDGSGYT